MNDLSWEHIIVAALVALPASVAAVSSVRNGHAIRSANEFGMRSEQRDLSRIRMDTGSQKPWIESDERNLPEDFDG